MSIFPAGEPLPQPLPVDPPVHERLAVLVDELRAAHLDLGENPGKAIANERIFDSWNLWCKCIAPLDSIDYPGKLRGETRSRTRPDVDLSYFERGLKTCLRNLGGIIEEIKSSPTPDAMARLSKATDRLADYLPAQVAKACAVDYRNLAGRMRQLKADALDHSIADARMKEYKAQGVSGYRYCVDAGVRARGIDAQLGVIRAGEGTTRTTETDLRALAWDMIAIFVGRPGDIDPQDRISIGGRVAESNKAIRPGVETATYSRPDGAWKIGIEDHALVCEQLAENLESWARGQVEPEPVKPTADEVEEDGDGMEVEYNGQVCRVKQPDQNADFTQVTWHGVKYTFTPGNQAEIVELLWKEWDKKPGNGLSQVEIGKKIGSKQANTGQFSLIQQFRRCKKPKQGEKRKYTMHPAWGTMIVSTGTRGCYMLAPHPIIE